MNFVVLYCNKNQYEMLEQFAFKHSPANFDDVDILVFDDNSIDEQKDKLRDLCEKYKNIKWINPDVSKNSVAPNLTVFEKCNEYLYKNEIDVNWMLFFENDVFPFQSDFWSEINKVIKNYDFLQDKVGSFGFSSYQKFDEGVMKTSGSPTMGRGCLLNGILNKPHSGWYKDLSDDWYDTDYFVVESVNWQSICVNRKLFNKYIKIDDRYDNRLLNFDDLAHQFMFEGFFNIVFPKISVYHDSGQLKEGINLTIDNSYSRSNNSHEVFKDRWKWSWGYRNSDLRNQFNLSFPKYVNKIQSKLFDMNVKEGPKRIEDFE